MATDVLTAEPESEREILVRVPRSLKSQLVFRQTRTCPYEPAIMSDSLLIRRVGPWSYRKYFKEFATLFGVGGALKVWLKLFTRRRRLFCANYNGALSHYTWTTLGRSRYYWIENDAVVIGPIWTASDVRGRNVAVEVLKTAVNSLIAQGQTVFYIDTSPTNDACLRVISKCGFSGPVGSFLRPNTL